MADQLYSFTADGRPIGKSFTLTFPEEGSLGIRLEWASKWYHRPLLLITMHD